MKRVFSTLFFVHSFFRSQVWISKCTLVCWEHFFLHWRNRSGPDPPVRFVNSMCVNFVRSSLFGTAAVVHLGPRHTFVCSCLSLPASVMLDLMPYWPLYTLCIWIFNTHSHCQCPRSAPHRRRRTGGIRHSRIFMYIHTYIYMSILFEPTQTFRRIFSHRLLLLLLFFCTLKIFRIVCFVMPFVALRRCSPKCITSRCFSFVLWLFGIWWLQRQRPHWRCVPLLLSPSVDDAYLPMVFSLVCLSLRFVPRLSWSLRSAHGYRKVVY